jgi:hypothetical protein
MVRPDCAEHHGRVSEALVTTLPKNLVDAIAEAGVDWGDAAE